MEGLAMLFKTVPSKINDLYYTFKSEDELERPTGHFEKGD